MALYRTGEMEVGPQIGGRGRGTLEEALAAVKCPQSVKEQRFKFSGH